MIRLGVNIDHVATLREARGGIMPDVAEAAYIAEKAGADGITIHLREDRRHIQDHDVYLLRKQIKTLLNLEMALSNEIIAIALDVVPEQVTFVPEKREELTTEGGLDVIKESKKIERVLKKFNTANIGVSLFIDPALKQIRHAAKLGVDAVELHTGQYAETEGAKHKNELKRLIRAAECAYECGLHVHAGHGLDYKNIIPICALPHVEELNIGHSIISRAIFTGLSGAVKEMKKLINEQSKK